MSIEKIKESLDRLLDVRQLGVKINNLSATSDGYIYSMGSTRFFYRNGVNSVAIEKGDDTIIFRPSDKGLTIETPPYYTREALLDFYQNAVSQITAHLDRLPLLKQYRNRHLN